MTAMFLWATQGGDKIISMKVSDIDIATLRFAAGIAQTRAKDERHLLASKALQDCADMLFGLAEQAAHLNPLNRTDIWTTS